MTRYIKWFIVLSFFLGAGLLAADNFLVTYAEGKVERKLGAAWKPVTIGDILPDTSEVRLGANGLLEMRLKKETVTVFQSGTYTLKNFIQPARERKAGRLFASVDRKVKAMAGTRGSRTKSAAAGVKAERKESADPGLAWPDEQQDPMADGLTLVSAEKYREAADYFEAALKSGHSETPDPELYYYLAFACDRSGQTARALKHADKIALDPDDPGFPDYAFLKGSLLVKGFAYAKALDVFKRYLTAFPKGDQAQDMLLLTAYCHRNTGNVARERESLERAVAVDPESDAGKEAAAQLKGNY